MTAKHRLDTTHHDRRLSRRLKEDPECRVEFERRRFEVAQIDSVVHQLDELREKAGMSKAELARAIGKTPSSIRRLFTADVNPELKTVAAVAGVLGAEVRVVPSGVGRNTSRQVEKQRSRVEDERALAGGDKSVARLKRENEVFASLAGNIRLDFSASRSLG
jgi:transcriptional regulator with XRE-family HTH domain